jgi:hypothetical protein
MKTPAVSPAPCPDCGGALGPVISGDVHCYVQCLECGHRFDLNDPRVGPGRVPGSTPRN